MTGRRFLYPRPHDLADGLTAVTSDRTRPEPRTRESIIAAAKAEHDKVCHCDPRYLMSCGRMAEAILAQGKKTKP